MDIAASFISNPYNGLTFWGFLVLFLQRIGLFAQGLLPFEAMASDELQILALMAISFSSALVGSFLVLRKMTMLANSLSHTLLLGVALAFFFSSFFGETKEGPAIPMSLLMIAGLLCGFLTSFLTEFLVRVGKLQEDASMGLTFTSLFAIGVIAVTVIAKNSHIGIEAVMGNIDALSPEDLGLLFSLCLINAAIFWLFFKEFALTTFDAALAYSLGFSPFFFSYLLMVQLSLTSMASFRSVGVLLVLSFMTAPVLTARLLTNRLRNLLLLAPTIGMVSSILGVAMARHMLTLYGLALSTSGIVVCFMALLYFTLTLAPTAASIKKFLFRLRDTSLIGRHQK